MALIRNITSSGSIWSRMVGILPRVWSLTHWLMVVRVAGAAKSIALILASKVLFPASRNAEENGIPWRAQIELAMANSTRESRPRSRSIRLRYPALISSIGAPAMARATRIESSVAPAAPFRVIPSAMEALVGERNKFSPGWARCTARNRSKANWLPADTIRCSALDRLRGSPVRRGGGPDCSVGPEQAAAESSRARRASADGMALPRAEAGRLEPTLAVW